MLWRSARSRSRRRSVVPRTRRLRRSTSLRPSTPNDPARPADRARRRRAARGRRASRAGRGGNGQRVRGAATAGEREPALRRARCGGATVGRVASQRLDERVLALLEVDRERGDVGRRRARAPPRRRAGLLPGARDRRARSRSAARRALRASHSTPSCAASTRLSHASSASRNESLLDGARRRRCAVAFAERRAAQGSRPSASIVRGGAHAGVARRRRRASGRRAAGRRGPERGARGGEPRAERGVLRHERLGRRGARARARLRDRRDRTDRLGVLEVRVDRGDDDARLDGDEVDADEGHAHPRVDDDPLVENAIENVDEARSTRCAFNGHVGCPLDDSRCSAPSRLAGSRQERESGVAQRRCPRRAARPSARGSGSAFGAIRSPP